MIVFLAALVAFFIVSVFFIMCIWWSRPEFVCRRKQKKEEN